MRPLGLVSPRPYPVCRPQTVPVCDGADLLVRIIRWVASLARRRILQIRGRSPFGAWVRKARQRSPWMLHFNSGGCNGCDIEIVALLTPRYDIERLGVLKVASPRHADILFCTGPVTRQARDRLLRIYEQMPAPKWVMAIGTCACSGGVFADGYNVLGGIDRVLPVSMYVPGCAARPEAIIEGLQQLLKAIS